MKSNVSGYEIDNLPIKVGINSNEIYFLSKKELKTLEYILHKM